MSKIALAEALLRRRELQEKVQQLHAVKVAKVFETKVKRVHVTENVDDLTVTVPLLTLAQVTREFDFYAKQLRMIDGVIQRANWETDVEAAAYLVDFDPSTDPDWGAKRK